jgi:hypothetical protein
MKKILLQLAFLTMISATYAQVGIGTATPSSSAMLEVSSTTKGMLLPRMTTAQRNDITAPVKGLFVYDTSVKLLYFHDGIGWVNHAQAKFGDVKSGLHAADHDGWVKLDGRTKSSLTTSQQARATALSIGTSLPDATSAYLSQAGGTLGAVTGSNTTTLTQANLPSVNFSGTAASAGDHSHTADPSNTYSTFGGDHRHTGNTDYQGSHSHGGNAGGGQANGAKGLVISNGNYTQYGNVDSDISDYKEPNLRTAPKALVIDEAGNHNHTFYTTTDGSHDHYVDFASSSTTAADTHTHSVTVSSGGSGSAITITPKSLAVNMFIYLGN